MAHKVFYTKGVLDEMKTLDKDVLVKIYSNFVQPIKNGLEPPDELQGKYKPSWDVDYATTPLKQAFIKASREQNLHHYHFGYAFYRDGRDPKYTGDVSDGILHIRIDDDDKQTNHTLFDVCLEHPSPFKIPFGKDTAKHQAA